VALGNAAGELPFHVPVYRGYPLDALSSLQREEAAGWLTAERIYWFNASKLSVDTIMVPVRTLDDYALAPSFVKMYVQGSEPAVIEGATRTLTRHWPAVLAPAEEPAVDAAMRRLGYSRFAHSAGGAAGHCFVRGGEGSYFSWYLAEPTLGHLKVPMVAAEGQSRPNSARAPSPSVSG